MCCLEKLFSKMTYTVSVGMLNPTQALSVRVYHIQFTLQLWMQLTEQSLIDRQNSFSVNQLIDQMINFLCLSVCLSIGWGLFIVHAVTAHSSNQSLTDCLRSSHLLWMQSLIFLSVNAGVSAVQWLRCWPAILHGMSLKVLLPSLRLPQKSRRSAKFHGRHPSQLPSL